MALIVTHLTDADSPADATSKITASISPAANQLVLAWIHQVVASGTANQPTATGNSLTWVVAATATSGTERITLFRALGPVPTAGAVTFDFGGQVSTETAWSICEIAGVDTGGTNGSGAVVQVVAQFGRPITLAAFSSATNGTVGGFIDNVPLESLTVGAGFALINTVGGASNNSYLTEWRVDNATSVDLAGTSGSVGGVALEIKPINSPMFRGS